jgi:hypothetical protein
MTRFSLDLRFLAPLAEEEYALNVHGPGVGVS